MTPQEKIRAALQALADNDFDWSEDCGGQLPYDEWVLHKAQEALQALDQIENPWRLIQTADKNETIDMFGPDNVLARAKSDTMDKAAQKAGCTCPVCDQYVKVYRRTINATMARQLITAWHKHGAGKYFHTRDVVLVDSSGAGDFSKLEYWGLIQAQFHEAGEDGKKSSGMWKITPMGQKFINGWFSPRQYAIVYNNKVLELTGESISIVDALGKRFNYNEIMGAAGPHMSQDASKAMATAP